MWITRERKKARSGEASCLALCAHGSSPSLPRLPAQRESHLPWLPQPPLTISTTEYHRLLLTSCHTMEQPGTRRRSSDSVCALRRRLELADCTVGPMHEIRYKSVMYSYLARIVCVYALVCACIAIWQLRFSLLASLFSPLLDIHLLTHCFSQSRGMKWPMALCCSRNVVAGRNC